MQIYINGQDLEFSQDKINVSEVVKVSNIRMPHMVSIQINGRRVSSSKFEETYLTDGDEIDYMYLMENTVYCLD